MIKLRDHILSLFPCWEEPLDKALEEDDFEAMKFALSRLKKEDPESFMFTSSHPMYKGRSVRLMLGTYIGNLHFLLGYVNPMFHVAEYHWQIIDPYLDTKEIKKKKHPANINYWNAAKLGKFKEGDLEKGEKHPKADQVENVSREKDLVKITTEFGTFVGDPIEQLVTSERTAHVYSWAVVKNSYFAYKNPEFTKKMEEYQDRDDESDLMVEKEENVSKALIGDNVLHIANIFKSQEFDDEVYPLLKSKMPSPGSIISVPTKNESLWAVVAPDSVFFVNKEGNPAGIQVFDRVYKSFSIVREGNIHPTILYNFMDKYISSLSKSSLEEYASEGEEETASFMKSNPTNHYSDIDSSADRRLFISGDTVTSVPRETDFE